MKNTATIYEMDLQQTVLVTVAASDAIPDCTEISGCSVQAVDDSTGALESGWSASVASAATVVLESTAAVAALSLQGVYR